jgi:hypothetical protein
MTLLVAGSLVLTLVITVFALTRGSGRSGREADRSAPADRTKDVR